MKEGFVPVQGARLFYREVGTGMPMLVLHGGPDFDHFYLLPEMDALSERFRLIYYDQRGRGRSSGEVQPADVSLESEIADLEAIRTHFGFESVTLLGHSWGALLALEYVAAHFERVRRAILMNPAPATHADYEHYRSQRMFTDAVRLHARATIAATPEYQAGDIEADARSYRLHFSAGMPSADHVETVVGRLRVHFSSADILKARAIEARLFEQTWGRAGYNVLERVTARGAVPTLILHGELDSFPERVVRHMERVLPDVRLEVLHDCGHFAYLERPEAVRSAIHRFVAAGRRTEFSARGRGTSAAWP